MTTARQPPWLVEVRQRVRTLAWLKALANTVFLIGFFQLYLTIQKHPAYPVTQIPATAVDHWIGFQPWSVGLYLSLWVYTALPVALQPDFRRFMRYGVVMTLLCAAGLVVFYFLPTSVSAAVGTRPGGDSAVFTMLYAVDSNGNACPSLHVAAAVLSWMWMHRMLVQMEVPRWLNAGNLLWCVGIVFSTMAIKQHLLIDVLAGVALGVVVGAWALRRHGPL